MTPQEIAERALNYGIPREPTIVFLALHGAAERFEKSDKSRCEACGKRNCTTMHGFMHGCA